jgi:hypothetical protein
LFDRADVDDQRPGRQLGPELVRWNPIELEAGVGEQLGDPSSTSGTGVRRPRVVWSFACGEGAARSTADV